MALSPRPALVSLLGAGPGDPGLITLRARDRLAEADVVVYDFLANEALLAHARPDAERVAVGGHGGPRLSQEEINAVLVDRARAGRRVARLKGGDPLVFGRAGEELEALAAAAVPFEIVPGVTAGLAAAAYAGIPVTHRGLAGAVLLVTGHEAAEHGPRVPWEALARGDVTLLAYMGVLTLERLLERLRAGGLAADTPAAIVCAATTPRQRTVEGTVGGLAALARAAGVRPPAIVIVGQVVRLRARLGWFETRPLAGVRIWNPRPRGQAAALTRALVERGADVVEAPAIEVAPPAAPARLDAAVAGLAGYDWVLFTSANGVEAVAARLAAQGRDARAFGAARIGAIGAATARALAAVGLRADVVAARRRAEGLLEALGGPAALAGRRLLLPRAAAGRDLLPEELARQGAHVELVEAYRVAPAPASTLRGPLEACARGELGWVALTSGSIVAALLDAAATLGLDGRAALSHARLAALGPVVAEEARALGLELALVAPDADADALAEAISDAQARPQGG